VESALLSLAGGAGGLFLAVWGTQLLMQLVPESIPVPNAAYKVRLPPIHVDGRVLAFTAAVALLTGILFGLIPALQAARCKVEESLKEGGRGSLSGRRENRARGILVISEAALAFVLVIGACLMIQSFRHLLDVDLGFQPHQLLTAQIKLPADAKDSPYRSRGERAIEFQRLLAAVNALPEVRSAALAHIVPMSQDGMEMGYFAVAEAPPLAPGDHLSADFRQVSPSFFATMGVPLVRGRVFTDHDTAEGPLVAIIDESLARRYFANDDPVGKHLHFGDATAEIAGVVRGVHDLGLDQEPRPTIYLTYLQSPEQTMSLVVRSDAPGKTLVARVKNAIWSVDKDQPVYNIRTMDTIIAELTSAQRVAFVLLGIFAFLAVTLAAVGIYGLTSYSVSQRTHEVGIRMALGAQRRQVMELMVGQSVRLAVAGVAIGTASALVLTQLMSSLLYGVSASDPATFAGAAVLLTLVSLAAAYFPARRATRVDPMIALRYE